MVLIRRGAVPDRCVARRLLRRGHRAPARIRAGQRKPGHARRQQRVRVERLSQVQRGVRVEWRVAIHHYPGVPVICRNVRQHRVHREPIILSVRRNASLTTEHRGNITTARLRKAEAERIVRGLKMLELCLVGDHVMIRRRQMTKRQFVPCVISFCLYRISRAGFSW